MELLIAKASALAAEEDLQVWGGWEGSFFGRELSFLGGGGGGLKGKFLFVGGGGGGVLWGEFWGLWGVLWGLQGKGSAFFVRNTTLTDWQQLVKRLATAIGSPPRLSHRHDSAQIPNAQHVLPPAKLSLMLSQHGFSRSEQLTWPVCLE